MILNDAEEEKVKCGLIQIREYVTKNCVPRLRKYESVSVKFNNYGFGFEDNGRIWGSIGGLVLRFNEDDPLRHNPSCGDLYVLNNLRYGMQLLLNWQEVKARINVELDNRDRTRMTIMNFEV